MKQNSKLIETDESVNILTPAIIPNSKHPGGRPNKDLTELKNEGAALFEAQKKELATYLYYTDAVNDGASLIANTLKTLNKNRKKNLLSMLDIKNLSLGLGIMQDKASLYKSKAIGKMTNQDNKGINDALTGIMQAVQGGDVNVTLSQTKQSIDIKGVNE